MPMDERSTDPTENEFAGWGEPAVPRRRRHALRWIVLLVVVLFLGGGAVAADAVARNLVNAGAKQAIIEKFGSDPSGTRVTTSGWSMLVQLVSGRLDEVTVTAPNATMTNLSGNVTAKLDGLPISASGTVKKAAIDVTIDQAQLLSYLASKGSSGTDTGTVSLKGSAITLSDQVTLLAQKVTVTATLTPEVVGGKLGFKVGTIAVGSQKLGSFFSDYVQSKLDTEQVCLASSLPKGLSVSSVTVTGGVLQIDTAGENVDLFSGAKGSCS